MKRRIGVIDFETDPFKFERLPVPFAWGFYNGDVYKSGWESDAWKSPTACARSLVDFLLYDLKEPHLILAHNGGKFDFLFFIEQLSGAIKIVNGRILQAELGHHRLRDSYAILPIPLSAAGDKLDIDYKLMERECREDHRKEIERYLKQDCIALHSLCTAFYDEFGDILTIGSAAMRQLRRFHDFESANESFDKTFRKYYFGGRCQCFEVGVINTQVKGYDLNSSYPYTMKSMRHPVSREYMITNKPGKNTAFVTWEGMNYGAVPIRTKQGLDFTCEKGTFFSTIHEFEAGLETGTIEPLKITEAIHFDKMVSFEEFIDHFYTSRLSAKANGDKFHEIFYKLILNSAYGKFAQSPENFEDSIILPWGDVAPEPYEVKYTHGKYAIWCKPSNQKTYFNVATAASITGGSRATLLRGLAAAKRPLYCDTDSIYCEELSANLHEKNLGAWKHEFTGEQIAIAGKKLYAVMGQKLDKKTGKTEFGCLKKASKGTSLNPLAIFMIAKGDTCETRNDAPTFKLDGQHQFIKRNIRRTSLT
jgi:hypothetical protein